MAKLKWTINYDHWEAVTDHGTYEVGDCGDNRAFVTIPGRGGVTVSPFDAGKDVAQAFYDARTSITPQEFSRRVQHWFDLGYRVRRAKMTLLPQEVE